MHVVQEIEKKYLWTFNPFIINFKVRTKNWERCPRAANATLATIQHFTLCFIYFDMRTLGAATWITMERLNFGIPNATLNEGRICINFSIYGQTIDAAAYLWCWCQIAMTNAVNEFKLNSYKKCCIWQHNWYANSVHCFELKWLQNRICVATFRNRRKSLYSFYHSKWIFPLQMDL